MRFCQNVNQEFTIELIRDGQCFQSHDFSGATRNAKSRAQKLAHEAKCSYRLKRKKTV